MPPAPLELSTEEARRTLLNLQGLARNPTEKLSKEALYQLIEDMGYVQLDSIRTVERAHHHILFSRNQTYRQKQLDTLYENGQCLTEQWTHDASIIPSKWFPYWKHRFPAIKKKYRQSAWWQKRVKNPKKALQLVTERIEQDGPVGARDFETVKANIRDTWWGWSPQKAALEYLWRTGELAVVRRHNFQKIYDQTHRVLHEDHAAPEVSRSAFVDWACRSALERLGVATPGEIARFWDALSPADVTKWLNKAGADTAVPVSIQGRNGNGARAAFARPDIEQVIDALEAPPNRIRLISPFDPVIRDRQRLERLFGFDYRIEIFVPEKKRKFGYYVFPILEGERFIGRIDLKAFRKENRLAVQGLWLEPKIKLTKGRKQKLEAELDRVRRFVGLDRIDPGITGIISS